MLVTAAFGRMKRIGLLLLAACISLAAINPEIRLDQFYHTRWTVKDGAPSGAGSITQTADGFLWFGTTSGLYHFDLSVEGSSKRMHPIARDEVYRIGYEAIRNACNHSTRLAVKISYLRDLALQVQDNGKGFEPSAVGSETGRGHFGLSGMYERAARIRGKLTISSSPGGGTRVELIVPRSVVFLGEIRNT